MSRNAAAAALERYDLDATAAIVRELQATHAAFEVCVDDVHYLLRQFNPWMSSADLRTQFVLAEAMHGTGLDTSLPVVARHGERFVEVADRLWALFPWCEGRPGCNDSPDDLRAASELQGRWVESAETLRSTSQWDGLVRTAGAFRRRKSWAWVVPLDRAHRFCSRHDVMGRARGDASRGPHRDELLSLLPGLASSVDAFVALLEQHRVDEMPHTLTHGDFWPSNVRLQGSTAVVLDLDCFCHEPRIADFARVANGCTGKLTDSENAACFEAFQSHARLDADEVAVLPLMMCAHDLYYAVLHVLLFIEEEDAGSRARTIESIRREMQAPERFARDGERLLRMYTGG